MLALVGELYGIEREAKDAGDAPRLSLRQERTVPVLAKIKDWLDTEGEVARPRSPLAAGPGAVIGGSGPARGRGPAHAGPLGSPLEARPAGPAGSWPPLPPVRS